MESLIFFVTGATSGIGKFTATLLARSGATVLIHGRCPERVKCTVGELQKLTGNQSVEGYVADLASLSAVRKLSDELHATQNRIDVLINNAGVYETTRKESQDGHELTLAVNILAPFLLTSLLRDLLRARAGHRSHVINVSSNSHYEASYFDLRNLQLLQEYPRKGHTAYEQSKLCEVMFTFDMAERFKGEGIRVNSLDPGTVNTKMLLEGWGEVGIPLADADQLFRLATESQFEEMNGEYLSNLEKTKALSVAYDEQMRNKLWSCLVEMTGAQF